MWWSLKGEEKTKKTIGKICKWICLVGLVIILPGVLIGAIYFTYLEIGWSVLYVWGGGIVFILVIFGAVFWGDK